jgi:hypothetical protein
MLQCRNLVSDRHRPRFRNHAKIEYIRSYFVKNTSMAPRHVQQGCVPQNALQPFQARASAPVTPHTHQKGSDMAIGFFRTGTGSATLASVNTCPGGYHEQ